MAAQKQSNKKTAAKTAKRSYVKTRKTKPLPTSLEKLMQEALYTFDDEEDFILKLIRLKEAGMSNTAIEEALGHWAAEIGGKVVRPSAWITAQENAVIEERADACDMSIGEYLLYLVYEDIEGSTSLSPLGKRSRLRRLVPSGK